jgi:hypothetical protein
MSLYIRKINNLDYKMLSLILFIYYYYTYDYFKLL